MNTTPIVKRRIRIMEEVIELSKEESYEAFMGRLKAKFMEKDFSGSVQSGWHRGNGESPEDFVNYMPEEFEFATCTVMDYAAKVLNGYVLTDWDREKIDICVTDISRGMSFETFESASIRLPKVWKEDKVLSGEFHYAFYALLFLLPEVEQRFHKAYELWRNSCEIGCIDRSKRTGLLYGWFFTSFDSYLFAVNAYKGMVIRSKERIPFAIGRLDIKLDLENDRTLVVDVKSGRKLASVTYDNRLHPLYAMDEVGSDFKRSEKEKRIAEGKKQKNTNWKTVSLGKLNGSNSYMRVHTFICLMFYGLEIMAPAIMEANSILTVDHIDGVHDNNNIDNLQLVSRKSNNNKKANSKRLFDYFCYFNDLPQPEYNAEEISCSLSEKIENVEFKMPVITRVQEKEEDELKSVVITGYNPDLDDFEEDEEENEEILARLMAKLS